jgi:NAD(P)H dehydrogenase (quinone)
MTSPTARIAVIHYSSTGNVYRLAAALAGGASDAGAEVRLRRCRETNPREVIERNPRWMEHAAWAEENLEEASLDDLEWANGVALGAPTRFGMPAAPLKQYLDQTGGLWAQGKLADKVMTGFTSASTTHGGLESTVLALLNTAYHWGSLVLPLGYTDPLLFRSGNPYGASWVSRKGSQPDDEATEVARLQGRRLARFAAAVAAA